MKFLLAAIIMTMFNTIILQVSEPQKESNVVQIIIAVTGLVTALGIIFNIYMTNRNRVENKAQLQEVAKGVDGITTKLIETKTTEAHMMGVKEATDAIGKQKAMGDAVRIEMMEKQQLKDQMPTQKHTDSNVKDVKEEIVRAVEDSADETHKKG